MTLTTRRALLLPAILSILALPLAAQAGGQGQDARALVEEAERVQHKDTERALRLLERALPLLAGPEDRALRLKALALRCWAAAESAEPDSLVALAERGLAEAERAGDARARASLRVCRGYGHDGAGRGARAEADYDFGAAEGRRLDEARVLADALLLRGELRYFRGEMGAALADLDSAYALHARLGSESRKRHALNAIANLYADSRVALYDRAIEYYRQLLASHRAAGSEAGIATAYFNLGSTLERKGDPEAALGYYRRALEMERRRGDAGEAAFCQRSIGVVLAKLGRTAEALRSLDEALAYFEAEGDDARAAMTRLSRGIALRGAGRAAQALADLDAARAHYEAPRNARFLEKVQDERALVLAALGDWQGAFEARTAQAGLQRELAEQLREEHTSRLRVQFDTEKKEQENRALLRENALRGQALRASRRIDRLQTAVMALSVMIMAIMLYLVFRHLATARRMRDLALTDELTRLPNRRHLLRVAGERLEAARRAGEPLSVLALDVDHFKRINDTHGHEAGDLALRAVADACRAALRHDDVMGRTGGEEFVVVLPRSDAAAAVEVAERLRTAVERVDWSGVAPGLRVTVSVGVAERAPEDDTFAALARRADDSLYRAKAGGRNRTEVALARA